jgi:hypothetical protein
MFFGHFGHLSTFNSIWLVTSDILLANHDKTVWSMTADSAGVERNG